METVQEDKIMIRVNNRLTIELGNNLVNHERSKHIDIHFHFIPGRVQEGSMKLKHAGSKEKIVYMFTKPLPTMSFQTHMKLIGMKDEII